MGILRGAVADTKKRNTAARAIFRFYEHDGGLRSARIVIKGKLSNVQKSVCGFLRQRCDYEND